MSFMGEGGIVVSYTAEACTAARFTYSWKIKGAHYCAIDVQEWTAVDTWAFERLWLGDND
jgi:hypothetical protein